MSDGNRIERRNFGGYERREEVDLAPNQIAIVGAGGAISNFHLNALLQQPALWTPAGILDINQDSYAPLLEAYPGLSDAEIFSDLGALLKSPDIHTVLVTTPSDVRDEIMRQVLRAGKHAIGEKPLVRTVEQFDGLLQLSEENGVTVECMYHAMFNDAVEYMSHQLERRADGIYHPEYGQLQHVHLLRADPYIVNGEVIAKAPPEGGTLWDGLVNCHAEGSRYFGIDFNTTSSRYVNNSCEDQGFPDVHSLTKGTFLGGTYDAEITWIVQDGKTADGQPVQTYGHTSVKDTILTFSNESIVELRHVPQQVWVNGVLTKDFSMFDGQPTGGRMIKEYNRGYAAYADIIRGIKPGTQNLTRATVINTNEAERLAQENQRT